MPRVAHGGGIGVVALADPVQRVAAAIATAVRGAVAVRVIDDARSEARGAAATGAVAVETLQHFRRIREQIDDGWRAYHNVQFAAAASRFTAAREAAEALLVLRGGAALYADASLRLGVVLARLGRTTAARDALALSLALDPERPISPLEFPPDTIAVIDTVRAQAAVKRSVVVTTEPSGAVLDIDGRDVGRAPVTVELSIGDHVAIARLPQFRARAHAFAVAETAVAETPNAVAIALDPDDVSRRLAAGPGVGMTDAETQNLVDTALLFADLDEVVLVAETDRDGDPALIGQRCAGVPATCTAIVEIAYGNRSGLATTARELWQDLRGQTLRLPPSLFGDSRLRRARRPRERCAVCRNPYVGAGVGATLVAGAIAIALVATASHPPPILSVDPAAFTHRP